jgi:transcriptional regulator with XRE-family HTH domain
MTQIWDQGLSARIAGAVRSARRESGLSAQDVADATSELGYPISRSRIANLENSRKLGVDIAELMVIAAALGIPPVALLFGGDPDDDIEMLPGRTETAMFSLAWFTGDTALAKEAVAQPDSTAATVLRLTRERAGFQSGLAAVETMASDYARSGNDEAAGRATMQAATLKEKIDELTNRIAVALFFASDERRGEQE